MSISHRAARLALRAKLATLAVVSTGSASLSATSTGYARAANSFLTDGFAIGMEAKPAGFTQLTPAVITALDALTMTILGGRTAEAAGAGKSLTVGLPSSRAWENVSFTPVAGVPYVEEEYVKGSSRRVTTGRSNAIVEFLPLYVVKIYTDSGKGVGAADAYSDALLQLFAPGTQITVTGMTLEVRGDVAPYSGQLLQAGNGFAVTPVNIPLLLRTRNPT